MDFYHYMVVYTHLYIISALYSSVPEHSDKVAGAAFSFPREYLKLFTGMMGHWQLKWQLMFQLKHTVNKCSFSKVEFDKATLAAVETKMKHLRRELCQHLPSSATGSEKRIALHSRKQTGSRQAMGDKDSQDAVNRADDLTPLPHPPSRLTPLFSPSRAPRNEDIFSH